MPVTLYWMAISHPSQAARKMLDLKGVDYELVNVVPLTQKAHLRMARFRRGTVPALKIDGRRLQGSRQIARALDQLWPEPPLFPSDPGLRARVEEAESWGERELQPIPRRLFRFAVASNPDMRRWALAQQGFPAVGLMTRASAPLIRYYARAAEPDGRDGDAAGVRASLAALPALLDHADALMVDGTLTTDPPNAATLQILSAVRTLWAFSDMHDVLDGRRSVRAARELAWAAGELPTVPPFVPAQWLAAGAKR